MVELDRSASLLQINVNEIWFTFANGDRGLDDVAVSGGDSVLASAAGAAGSATGAAVAVAAAGAAAVAAAGWLLASPDEGRRACPISCR